MIRRVTIPPAVLAATYAGLARLAEQHIAAQEPEIAQESLPVPRAARVWRRHR